MENTIKFRLQNQLSRFRMRFKKSTYLLILFFPCLLYFIIFKYIPMFGIAVAFQQFSLFKGVWASPWVGFKHFEMFINSPDFYEILGNTFWLGVYRLAAVFPLAIVFALILNEVTVGWWRRTVQSISYIPHYISNVVVGGMVLMFLSPIDGIVNRFLSVVGMEPIHFMIHAEMFRPIYALSEVWQHLGWEAIIYLAALAAIDPQLYEAATIDGANRWHKLVHITMPGITPVIVILLILNIGFVMEIGFEKVFLMSNPSIYSTADVIATYVYRVGLTQGNFSYAAAIDTFTSVICLLFITTANWLSRKVNETSLW